MCDSKEILAKSKVSICIAMFSSNLLCCFNFHICIFPSSWFYFHLKWEYGSRQFSFFPFGYPFGTGNLLKHNYFSSLLYCCHNSVNIYVWVDFGNLYDILLMSLCIPVQCKHYTSWLMCFIMGLGIWWCKLYSVELLQIPVALLPLEFPNEFKNQFLAPPQSFTNLWTHTHTQSYDFDWGCIIYMVCSG